MSDTRPQDQPDEAMVDLLIKQVTEGLSPAEQRALDVMDSERRERLLAGPRARRGGGYVGRQRECAAAAAGSGAARGAPGGATLRRGQPVADKRHRIVARRAQRGRARRAPAAAPRSGGLWLARGRGVLGAGHFRLESFAAAGADGAGEPASRCGRRRRIHRRRRPPPRSALRCSRKPIRSK